MIITAGILFYLLNKNHTLQHICHDADRMPLYRVEHFHGQTETENGILYMDPSKEGVLLFCSERRQKTSQIRKEPFLEGNDGFSSLWIPHEHHDRDEEEYLADEILEYIHQTWKRFVQIQNEILEAVLKQEPIEGVMEKAKGMIRESFIIVDRDMLLIYDHPEAAARLRKELGDDYSDKIMEELLLAKEFHEAARKRTPFYYELQSFGSCCYCINIVPEGDYYARLVVYAEEGHAQLSSGAEQIAEYIAQVLVQMIRGGFLQTRPRQKDVLHTLFSRLLQGDSPKAEEIRDAIAGYYWEENQTYQVICLEPYHAVGWDTQIENTMPTITRKLEQNRRHSCAVFFGKQILWVINRSLSVRQAGDYELTQQMMLLLRENVLKAGASSEFREIRLLESAWKQAKAALKIGTGKDPSYWFYRFDDYRLSYMIGSIQEKEIDTMLMVHPAIPLLLKHDQIHENELAKTLEAFIDYRGNVTQAAEALFIHRTTLFRRLNQIRELTKIDLDDTKQMLELQLSFRLLKNR